MMPTTGSGSVPRIYRITPWPIRIGAPLVALVVIVGLLQGGVPAAVPIPIILAGAWVYAAERFGLVVSPYGIQSRMTRRENRFRHPWSDIDGFELVENGTPIGIVMRLRDGSRKLLPSTRAWFWDKNKVNDILAALVAEQAATEATLAR